MYHQCHCGAYIESSEDVCLECDVNDSIDNDTIDRYFEYEYVLNDTPVETVNETENIPIGREKGVCWDCGKKVDIIVFEGVIYAETTSGYKLVICKKCQKNDGGDY